MKILIFEDQREIREDMKNCIEDRIKNVEVLTCKNVYEAKDRYTKAVDIIIVDLFMDSIGLKEEEISETKNGLYTGWIWLKYYVFHSQNYQEKQKIVILSDYANALIKFGEQFDGYEKDCLNKILVLPKSRQAGDYANIIDEIIKHKKIVEKL